MLLDVIPYLVENNVIFTCEPIVYIINEWELGVQMAASRAITEWYGLKKYSQNEWDSLQAIWHDRTKLVMVHVTYFSYNISDSTIYIPIHSLPEGILALPSLVAYEEILISNYNLSQEYKFLEKALRNEEIHYPLPVIHNNPDYAVFHFFDEESNICGFVEAWSTSIFSQPFDRWQHYFVVSGQLPSKDALKTIKGIILLGGKFSANDQYNWLINLKSFLREINEDYPDIKVVGICLGAQIIAKTFGGTVEKMKNKYILGYETVFTTNEFRMRFENTREVYKIAENHGENAVRLPSGWERWGYSNSCPNEIFGVQGKWLCFQSHPNYAGKISEIFLVPWFTRGHQRISKEAEKIIFNQSAYRFHTNELLGLIKNFLMSYTVTI
ncbi:unnamed protein product [Blepharisma stoltei]|uniref:Glutamine amidotransferase domain-containing protein n=1 Tax=Blepharisma stoltei TaxID=1481888 RepID=A0AAU9K1Q0_9CILI|nr:unnamed protein product [Blepharisma stoltei]